MRETRRRERGWMCLVTALVLGACGDGTDVEVDPAVAPFVGTWDATAFTVTSDADPGTVVDVLSLGAFHINVEPSGLYTATLEIPGVPPEIGQLSVSGSTIILNPTTPATAPTATSTYSFTSPDYLVLDGPTEFDFNVDDIDEPAQAHIELQRR